MIERRETIKIEPTPEELAAEFLEMGADYQAEFFNAVYMKAGLWDKPFVFQLQAITDSPILDSGGRDVMEKIGQYSEESMISKELTDANNQTL